MRHWRSGQGRSVGARKLQRGQFLGAAARLPLRRRGQCVPRDARHGGCCRCSPACQGERQLPPRLSRPLAIGHDTNSSFNSPLRHSHVPEESEDFGDTLLHGFQVGIDGDIGVFWRFIGVGDTGEVRHLAFERFLIETFDIAPRQLRDRTAHIDLHKFADHFARLLPRGDRARSRR